MKRLLRALLIAIALLLMLVAVSPGLVYLAALSQIDGRPQPDASPPLSVEQQNWLRCELGASDRDQPTLTNPWSAAARFLRDDPRFSYGDHLSGLIARHYFYEHLQHPHGVTWAFTETALTVWIARHWTLDQMETAGHALMRDFKHFRCEPGANEWPEPAPAQ